MMCTKKKLSKVQDIKEDIEKWSFEDYGNIYVCMCGILKALLALSHFHLSALHLNSCTSKFLALATDSLSLWQVNMSRMERRKGWNFSHNNPLGGAPSASNAIIFHISKCVISQDVSLVRVCDREGQRKGSIWILLRHVRNSNPRSSVLGQKSLRWQGQEGFHV
jgi:hypothetical protein